MRGGSAALQRSASHAAATGPSTGYRRRTRRNCALLATLLQQLLLLPPLGAAPAPLPQHGRTAAATAAHQPAVIGGNHDDLQSGLHVAAASTAAVQHQRQLATVGGAASAAPVNARVVVVNDIAGHFEVLAGVLTTLLLDVRLAVPPRVVYAGNPQGPDSNGLRDWLGQEVVSGATWLPLGSGSGAPTAAAAAAATAEALKAPADAVVCVSAELAPKVCSQVLGAVAARLLVIIVHRADTHSRNARILSLAPRGSFRLMALAPHVANLSSHMLREAVDWSMPVAPYVPRTPCAAKACLRGFALQGALRRYKSKHGNGFTRDYRSLWARLLQLRAAGHAVPGVVVVGKGQRRDLGVPPELDGSVAFHPWLRYPEFWDAIHHAFALVPAFGMPVYYESRISSTILASLIACVPVIAEQRLLDTYTFLTERHVFLRQPGEDEAAAMVRVAAMPEADILARRAALCELRAAMNARAAGVLGGYIRQAAAAAG